MLFRVGVELPVDEKHAFGIIVPVFDKIGFGCCSAADYRDEIAQKAEDVILFLAEEAINNGFSLNSLINAGEDYVYEYPEFTQWFTLDVPVEALIK